MPAANDDVFIPAGAARMPVLTAAAAARKFTVEAGATMTDNGALTVLGDLINHGTFGGTGTLRSSGAGPHRVGGTLLRIGSLTAGPAATIRLTGPVQVQHVLRLDGNLTTDGHALTLLADADGTAMVVNGAGTATGAVTVQRYQPAGRTGRVHVATPVQQPTVGGLGTPDAAPEPEPATTRTTVAAYRSAADFKAGWSLPAATATPLVSGVGYAAPGAPPTLTFTGELGNGPYLAGGLARSAATPSGWWLLGNPYPAPLAWDQTLPGATGLDAALYTLQSAGRYEGTYASFVRGVSVNGGSNIIPLGQAFFVRNSRPGTTASLRFTNAARLSTYSSPPAQAAPEARTLLTLEVQGSGGASQVAVYFEAGATRRFDSAFDAYQLPGQDVAQLAVAGGAEPLAVQALPLLTAQDEPVPLLVLVPRAGRYTLRATQLLHLPAGTIAYLLDAETGARINLEQQPAYSFSAPARPLGPRFSLLFTAPRPLADLSNAQAPGFADPAALVKKAVGVEFYNFLDETVRHYTLSPQATAALELSLAGLIEGIYVVQMLSTLGRMNQRRRLRYSA
ncbi:hypothetical protein [Hymenobacter algoricola]|uniref:hypothetical protein n=1 Tax=Hymenobacter algoricola TaxID=486267 RepID=UPI0031E5B9D8